MDAGEREASYRLLIDELPNLDKDSSLHKPEVKVLTQVSLPVYLEPARVSRVPVLQSATIEHGTLILGIGDDGTQRLDAQGVHLLIADRGNQPLGRHDQMENYVLAGSTGYLRIALSPAECERAGAVTVSWPSLEGAASTHPISRGSGACWGAGSR